MEIVYFGKKQPYTFTIAALVDGVKKPKVFHFTPFKAQEVPDVYGKIIMSNGGKAGIFKRLDQDERKPVPKPQATGDGYVGDLPASMVTKEILEKERKEEAGKDIEDVIAEAKEKEPMKRKPFLHRKRK